MLKIPYQPRGRRFPGEPHSPEALEYRKQKQQQCSEVRRHGGMALMFNPVNPVVDTDSAR
jgi:hypothetical protein